MVTKKIYKYLQDHSNPVVVIEREGRTLFVNRSFIQSDSNVIKSLPLFSRGSVAIEDLLNIRQDTLSKINLFLNSGAEIGDLIYINNVIEAQPLIIQKIDDDGYMVEIITSNGTVETNMTTESGGKTFWGFQNLLFPLMKSPVPDKPEGDKDIYKQVINNTIDGFFLADDHFMIIHYNSSFEEFLVNRHRSAEGFTIIDLVAPSSKKILRKKLQSVVRTQNSDTVEVELESSKGLMHCLLSLNVLATTGGESVRIYGFVRDISQIKNLQHQLEMERNYNRGIIEKVNLGFVFVNDDNQYLDFNDEYLRILDRNANELKSQSFYTFTAPQYIEKQKILMKEMIRTGKSFIFEKEFIRKDGSLVPVLVSLSRLFDKEGKPMGNFAFVRDISDQKQIQEELIEHNTKIQNMITLYNKLTAMLMSSEGINDVFEIMAQSIYDLLNPAALEILYNKGDGFLSVKGVNEIIKNRERLLDEKVSLVIKMLVDKREPVFIRDVSTELNDEDVAAFPGLANHQSAMFLPMVSRNAVAVILILSFETSIYELDDMHINMLMGIANLGSIVIERIRYVEEQEMMRVALDRYERLTAMGRIIAGVAHEINNPLSIMQLDLDELKTLIPGDGASSTKINMELIQSIQEEISRLSTIVKQLKDYSNPESIGLEIIQVDEVFRTFPLKVFFKNLQKKGISINLKLSSGKAEIQIPKNRLIQVIMNLLSNADDAIENKGTGVINVETGRIFREGQMVYISVRDNGVGIPEEHAKKIFEPFFTTKKKEGTGLGLSISYSIVKSHKGEIIMTSEENRGSDFTVYFPETI